jgi:hypothetical protein
MAHVFVYLATVADWSSLRVLSHRVSISMEADFCIEALEEALAKHGKPEIFNTDRGSQFTSAEFTGMPLKSGIAISHWIAAALATGQMRGGRSRNIRYGVRGSTCDQLQSGFL